MNIPVEVTRPVSPPRAMPRRLALVSLFAATVVTGACDPQLLPPPAAVTFEVNGNAAQQAYSQSQATRVTVEIAGLLAESPLALDAAGALLQATGFFEISIENQQASTAVVRLYGSAPGEANADTVLVQNNVEVTLERALNTVVASVVPGEPGVQSAADEPGFDLNRNGVSNLDDALNGCAPGVPEPLAALGTGLIEFLEQDAAFDRDVFSFRNRLRALDVSGETVSTPCGDVDAEAISVRVGLLGAAGTHIEQLALLTDENGISTGATQSVLSRVIGDARSLILTPGEQSFTNMVFSSPADERVEGAAVVTAEHCRCGYQTQEVASVVANLQYAYAPPPANYIHEAVVIDDAYTGEIIALDPALLYGGVPFSVAVGQNQGRIGETDAALAYSFSLDAPARVSALASQLTADVDVTLMRFDAGTTSVLLASTFAGIAPESLERDLEAGTYLVVLTARDAGAASIRLSIHAYAGPVLDAPPVPSRGAQSGGDAVTLSGQRLDNVVSVKFGAQDSDIAEQGAAGTSLTVTAPAGVVSPPLNPASIVVTGPGGRTARLSSSYIYLPAAPTLLSADPDTIPVGGVVRLLGAGFTSAFGTPDVRIQGVSAPVLETTPGAITVVAPDVGALGPVSVSVRNLQPGESAAPTVLEGALTYVDAVGPAPTLSGLDPAAGPQAGGFELTATGSDFVSGARLLIGGTVLDATFVDAGTLRAPVVALTQSGTLDVRVQNPDGQASAPITIDIAPTPTGDAPRIDLVLPQPGIHAHVPGDVIQLYGANLDNGAVAASISDQTDTFLAELVSVTAGLVLVRVLEGLPPATSLTLTLLFSDGQGATSPPFLAEAPSISQVTTDSPAVQTSPFRVLVLGERLFGSAVDTVRFTPTEGPQRTFPVVETTSDGLLTVEIPALGLVESTYTVEVVYSNGFEILSPNDLSVSGTCGNGTLEAGEMCDGNVLDGQTCISLGYDAGALLCSPSCLLDESLCGTCGDGRRDGNEACDGGDFGGASCTALGFASGNLECESDCTVSTTSCAGITCGDGVCSVGETQANCSTDCTQNCGDGVCNMLESCSACAADCGNCIVIRESEGDVTTRRSLPTDTIPRVRIMTDRGGPGLDTPIPFNAYTVAQKPLAVQARPEGTLNVALTKDTTSSLDPGWYRLSFSAGPQLGAIGAFTIGGGPDGNVDNSVDIPLVVEDLAPGTVGLIGYFRNSTHAIPPDGAPMAGLESLGSFQEMLVTAQGDLIVSLVAAPNSGAPSNTIVYRVDDVGRLHRIVGSSTAGEPGDGGPAGDAETRNISHLRLAPDGRLCFRTGLGPIFRVRCVTPSAPMLTPTADDPIDSLVLDADGSIEDVVLGFDFDADGNVVLNVPTSGSSVALWSVDRATGVRTDLSPAGCAPAAASSGLRIHRPTGTIAFQAIGYCGLERGVVVTDGRTHTHVAVPFPSSGLTALHQFAPDGSLVVFHPGDRQVERVGVRGSYEPLLGDGESGIFQPGGLAIETAVAPNRMALDPTTGDLYFVNTFNSNSGIGIVRRALDTPAPIPQVTIEIVAGDMQSGFPTVRLPTALRILAGQTLDGQSLSVQGVGLRYSSLQAASFTPAFPHIGAPMNQGEAATLLTLPPEAGPVTIDASIVDVVGRSVASTSFTATADVAPPGLTLPLTNYAGLTGAPTTFESAPGNYIMGPGSAGSYNGMAVLGDDLIVAESTSRRIIRLQSDGQMSRLAGGGLSNAAGSPVMEANLTGVAALAVRGTEVFVAINRASGPVNQLLVFDSAAADPVFSLVAGGGPAAPIAYADISDDPALRDDPQSVQLRMIADIAVTSDAVYISSQGGEVLRIAGGLVHRWLKPVACSTGSGGALYGPVQTRPGDDALYVLAGTLEAGDAGQGCATPTVRRYVDTAGVATLDTVARDALFAEGLNGSHGIAFAGDNAFYTDSAYHRIYHMDLVTGATTQFSGTYNVAGFNVATPRVDALYAEPDSIVVWNDDLIIYDRGNQSLRRIVNVLADLP